MLKQVIRGQKFQIFDMGIFGKLSVRPFGICTLFISKLAWITLKPNLDHVKTDQNPSLLGSPPIHQLIYSYPIIYHIQDLIYIQACLDHLKTSPPITWITPNHIQKVRPDPVRIPLKTGLSKLRIRFFTNASHSSMFFFSFPPIIV